jgi:hypothetical protein
MNIIAVNAVEGELLVDSRLIARRLGIQHETLMRTIERYQDRIEDRFGAIRFEVGSRLDGNLGGKQPVYALLNEPQATVLMSFSRNTDEVLECKMDLVEAFEKAKQLLVSSRQPQLPRFYQRLVLFNQRTGKIPTGYFCVFSETLELVGQLEAHGYTIPDHLTIDISIGSCWCNYMRKTLELEPKKVCRKYDHWYPGQPYPVQAYIYPLRLLPEFREWFDITYCRNQLLHYLKKNDPSALPAVNRFLGLLSAASD